MWCILCNLRTWNRLPKEIDSPYRLSKTFVSNVIALKAPYRRNAPATKMSAQPQRAALSPAAPSLDARHTIPKRLENLGISRTFFAAYCGDLSSAELSRLLSGQRNLGGERTVKLTGALRELESLVSLFKPVRLQFDTTDIQTIRQLARAAAELDALTVMTIRVGLNALSVIGANCE